MRRDEREIFHAGLRLGQPMKDALKFTDSGSVYAPKRIIGRVEWTCRICLLAFIHDFLRGLTQHRAGEQNIRCWRFRQISMEMRSTKRLVERRGYGVQGSIGSQHPQALQQ